MALSEIVAAFFTAIIVCYAAVLALMVTSLFMIWKGKRNGK